MLGSNELIIIFLIVLIVFGSTKIPQLGKGLGEGIRNFKAGLKVDDAPPAETPAAPPVAAATPVAPKQLPSQVESVQDSPSTPAGSNTGA